MVRGAGARQCAIHVNMVHGLAWSGVFMSPGTTVSRTSIKLLSFGCRANIAYNLAPRIVLLQDQLHVGCPKCLHH